MTLGRIPKPRTTLPFGAIVVVLIILASPIILVKSASADSYQNTLPEVVVSGTIRSLIDVESIDSVYSASVTDVTSSWNLETGLIESSALVLVYECHIGECTMGHHRVTYLGGEVDDIGLRVSDQPTIEVGTKVTLVEEWNGKTLVLVDKVDEGKSNYGLSSLRWSGEDMPINYHYNQDNVPFPNTLNVIQKSFDTWSLIPNSFLTFKYSGETTTTLGRDGQNTIIWGEIDGRSNKLGRTHWWYESENKRLLEFDMTLDVQERWTTDNSSAIIDLETVVLHEAGHALGLKHNDSSTVMKAYYSQGDISRNLGQLDVDVVKQLYSTPDYSFVTKPEGLNLVIDGTSYITPVIFNKWVPSSRHLIDAIPIVFDDNQSRYIWRTWSDGGFDRHIISVDSSDTEILAEFSMQHFVTVTSEFGSVNGAGWVDEGNLVNLSIDPIFDRGDGSREVFSRWTGDSESLSPSIELEVIAPMRIHAEWITEYLLAVNDDLGIIDGVGWYRDGDIAVISTPSLFEIVDQKTRMIFEGWEGNVEQDANPLLLTMNSPKNITARWSREHFLSIDAGRGIVDVDSKWFPEGSIVSINADTLIGGKEEGSRIKFSEWIGSIETVEPSIVVEINTFKELQAKWIDQFLVEVDPNGGRVSSPMFSDQIIEKMSFWIDSNNVLLLSAVTPSNIVPEMSRTVFNGWSGNAIDVESANIHLIIDKPQVISTQWVNEFFLIVDAGGGDLTMSSSWVKQGDVVTITAISPTIIQVDEERLIFSHWTDLQSSNSTVTMSINSPKRIEAEWNTQYFVSIDAGGMIIDAASAWLDRGSVLEIHMEKFRTIDPMRERLRFVSWSGSLDSSDINLRVMNSSLYLAVSSPEVIVAETVTQYYLELVSDSGPILLGTKPLVSGDGWYDIGSEVSIFADEASGLLIRQVFTSWTGDIIEDEHEVKLVMDSPKQIKAVWETDFIPLTIIVSISIISIISMTLIILRKDT